MTVRRALLAGALLVSAALAAFGDKEPVAATNSIAHSEPNSISPQKPAYSEKPQARRPSISRLIPRDELIDEDSKFGDAEGAVFSVHSWTPPPAPVPQPSLAPPAPPPTAPPVPFVYIGKAISEDKWEIYLSAGTRVLAVKPGDVIDGTWRIDAISAPTMTLTYLPLNLVQQMNIGANE